MIKHILFLLVFALLLCCTPSFAEETADRTESDIFLMYDAVAMTAQMQEVVTAWAEANAEESASVYARRIVGYNVSTPVRTLILDLSEEQAIALSDNFPGENGFSVSAFAESVNSGFSGGYASFASDVALTQEAAPPQDGKATIALFVYSEDFSIFYVDNMEMAQSAFIIGAEALAEKVDEQYVRDYAAQAGIPGDLEVRSYEGEGLQELLFGTPSETEVLDAVGGKDENTAEVASEVVDGIVTGDSILWRGLSLTPVSVSLTNDMGDGSPTPAYGCFCVIRCASDPLPDEATLEQYGKDLVLTDYFGDSQTGTVRASDDGRMLEAFYYISDASYLNDAYWTAGGINVAVAPLLDEETAPYAALTPEPTATPQPTAEPGCIAVTVQNTEYHVTIKKVGLTDKGHTYVLVQSSAGERLITTEPGGNSSKVMAKIMVDGEWLPWNSDSVIYLSGDLAEFHFDTDRVPERILLYAYSYGDGVTVEMDDPAVRDFDPDEFQR